MMPMHSYPLCWPDCLPRTSPSQRVRSDFNEVTLGTARDQLYDAAGRIGGTNLILSTNVKLTEDGLPRKNASNPKDPGVAVYFQYSGKQCDLVCDVYRYVWENILLIENLMAGMPWSLESKTFTPPATSNHLESVKLARDLFRKAGD
jgi:hypothetical protein